MLNAHPSRVVSMFFIIHFSLTFKDSVYAKAMHYSQEFPGVESALRNDFAKKLEIKLL